MRRLSLSLVLVVAVGCAKEEAAPTAETTVADAMPPTNPAPAIANQPAYVTSSSLQRKQPSEASKIDENGKQVNNYLATLQRGEQVTMLKQEGDWVRIKASDESEGWVKTDDLLAADGLTLATTLEEVKTFDRPDYSALNATKTLPIGALLFITKAKDPFSEVNYQSTRRVWVLTEKLATETNEVEAARVINRARWMDEKKNPAAKEFWDLARSKFGTSKLMTALNAAAGLTPEGTPAADAPTAPAPQQVQTGEAPH